MMDFNSYRYGSSQFWPVGHWRVKNKGHGILREHTDAPLLAGWMPLYVYAFPVTAISAVLLALGGIGLEGLTLSASGEICGPFNWVRKCKHWT